MLIMTREFRQVDVFTSTPYRGNPVAVVHGADGLDTERMQAFAHWTNLSETTFLLPPTDPRADYRVRIFTPVTELPFAGHPTLGTCHAWLEAGGTPRDAGTVVQECAAGLIPVRRGDVLAFAAPPLVREGPAEPALVEQITTAFGIDPADVLGAEWVDNGPGWVALRLASVEAVLAARPSHLDLDVGLVALYPAGAPQAVEVRGLFPANGAMIEDPVTGSLNASVAGWLLREGLVTAPYEASQGTALGRAGRVRVSRDDDGTIWVGGGTVTCVSGTVEL